MIRKEVKSGNIKSIGYDRVKKTMEIEFNKGSVYKYFNVDLLIFDSINSYNSINNWFIEKVKNNDSISYEKLV